MRETTISTNRKLREIKAKLLCLKRLHGIPFSGKMRFLTITVFGEILRTRIRGSLGLRIVEISLTERCQCRCRHCFAASQQALSVENELSTERVKILIDDLSQLGVPEICFSGGEPLLRKDILELVSHAHRKGVVVRLITNGILLNEQMIVKLKRAGLNWCSVSIDSSVPETHDGFRQYTGCYNKAIEGLELLVRHKVPCNIITVARKNLLYSGELEEIIIIGRRIGVTNVRINFPVPMGRFKNQDNQTLDLEERERVRELLRYGNVVLESPNEGTRCTAAVTKVNILSNGNVTPCVFVPLSYGNILEKKFFEIWESMAEFNQQFKVNGQCPMCIPLLRERMLHIEEKQ